MLTALKTALTECRDAREELELVVMSMNTEESKKKKEELRDAQEQLKEIDKQIGERSLIRQMRGKVNLNCDCDVTLRRLSRQKRWRRVNRVWTKQLLKRLVWTLSARWCYFFITCLKPSGVLKLVAYFHAAYHKQVVPSRNN